RRIARCPGDETCELLGTTADGRSALLLGHQNGDLAGLLEIGPDGAVRTLHRDPAGIADIDDVVLDPTGRPAFASYRTAVPAVYGLTPAMREAMAKLEARIGERDLRITIGGNGGDGAAQRWLVEVHGDLLARPRFVLFEPGSGRIEPILAEGAPGAE